MGSMNGRLSSFSQVERKGHVFVNPALKQTCLQLLWESIKCFISHFPDLR